MFESFYELARAPFAQDIPTTELYESVILEETLGRLAYAAKRQWFAVVTGDCGTGKTTTIRRFADVLDPARYKVLYVDAQSPMALILVGQSELWDRLNKQIYAAIRQRIDLQCKLPHYDRAQTGEYIQRHLAYAGAERAIFTDGAVDEIFRYSSGSARLINKVCTHCLLYGAQNRHQIIDDHMMKRVIAGELA